MKHARRLLPLLLILCFVVTFATTAVFAESGETSPPPTEATEPTEAPPTEESAEPTETPTEASDPAKRDVIDKPWEITRPESIYADSYFSNNVNAATLTYLSKDGITKVCYCIEPGVPITNAGVSAGFTSNEEIAAWNNLSDPQQAAIALVLAYGYPTVSFNDISTSGVAQKYGATQLIIWEIIDGVRNPYTFQASDMYCNYFNAGTYPTLYAVYNKIHTDLLRHDNYPSFTTQWLDLIGDHTYDLSYDAASGKYICILKDTETDTRYQTLPDYNFVSNIEGLTVTRTDNVTLRIECTPEVAVTLPSELTFSAVGKAVTADCDSTITVWEAAGTTDQKLVSSSGARDPVPVYFRLKVAAAGTMTMQKTSTCGAVEGYRFKIWHKESNKVWYGTADANGAIYQTDENGNHNSLGYTFEGLADGTYSVRELLSVAPDTSVFPDSWRVTVTDAGGNITYDHTFTKSELTKSNGDCSTPAFTVTGLTGGGKMTMVINNAPTLSDLEIVKTSPDGNVEGITFVVKDSVGTELWRGKSDANGKLTVPALEIGKTYIVEEIVPDGYAPQEPQNITIQAGTNRVSFQNIPLSSLQIVKKSPDGNIAGISFNVYFGDKNYENGTVMQTVVSGEDGTLQIDSLDAGIYWIEEIVPDGYAPQEAQRVELTYANNKEHPAVITFTNVPLSSLQIIKTSSDGKVSNISFNIYKGDADYENGAIWKTVKTGTTGTIQIDNLDAGVYWVEEIVPQGYEGEAPKRVEITQANTKNNPATVSFYNRLVLVLQIIKQSPDGNVAGITFNIYTSQPEYDNGAIWKTAVTDENGVILLDVAEAGIYVVEEVVPAGYQPQGSKTVMVSKDNTADNPAVVTFVNSPLTTLKIIKESPDGNVAGITFNIYSGRSMASATLLQTAQTDEHGVIEIYGLTVGTYWIEEIVPEGYAPQEPKHITLLSVHTASNPATVTFVNEPIRGLISVNKVNTANEPLSGATFLLEYSTDGGVTWTATRPASKEDNGMGTCVGVDENGKITTGADGKAVFKELLVIGVQYRLTETEAPAGYQLLAEPIGVAELTANEEKNYEIYLDVVNVPIFQLPPTGANGNIGFFVSIASIGSIASIFGLYMLLRKRNRAEV